MPTQRSRRFLSSSVSVASISLGLATLTTASGASAAGFNVARFGGEHGHPTTTNATALYYNPAGIAASEGIHLYIDGNFAYRAASYEHQRNDSLPAAVEQPDAPTAEGANYGEASLFNFAASPTIGLTAQLDHLAIGLAFFTPFGGAAKWDQNDALKGSNFPGAVDGVQRWYSISGRIQSSYVTLGAAYEFEFSPGGPALSVGAGANAIISLVQTLRARNADGSNKYHDNGQPDGFAEGRSYLDVSGLDFSFGAGLMLEAMPDELWLGVSYQSRPNISGGMKLTGTLKNVLSGSTSETDVALYQDLPDVYRFGGRFRPDDTWEFRLFGDLQRWSALEQQCLGSVDKKCEVNQDGSNPQKADVAVTQNQLRRWEDAFAVRGGASYFTSESLELIGGLGYSGAAVPDETLEPALIDFSNISIAVGARFGLTETIFLATTYTQLIYFSRDTTGKSEQAQFQVPSRSPDSGGKYSQSVGVVNVNLDFQF